METELKLRLPPEAAAALRRHPLLARLQLRKPWRRRVENQYFDTPALDLWQAGLELRLRRDGTRLLQALKAPLASEGGLHRRHEWEAPLRRAELDLAALTGWLPPAALAPAAAAALHEAARQAMPGGGLRPRVTTRYNRSTWQLQTDSGALIELALDLGSIVALASEGEGSGTPGNSSGHALPALPLAEIELELKTGPELALFELAAALQADLPLRPEMRGKAERGFALLAGQPQAPRHARPVALEASMGVALALRTCAEECLAQVLANELGLASSDDAEYLHQIRVGLRRLRSVLDLFNDVAEPPPALLQELRWANGVLAGARDAQVLALETLARVPPPVAADLDWPALRAAAAKAAERARREALAAVESPRQAAWQVGLMAWLTGLTMSDEGTAPVRLEPYAERRLRRLRKRLLARGRGLPHAAPAARHRARIAAKKLRYAAQVLSVLAPAFAEGRSLRALTALQDRLGELNDAEVAEGLLAALAAESAAEIGEASAAYARGWLAADSLHRASELDRLWRRVAKRL